MQAIIRTLTFSSPPWEDTSKTYNNNNNNHIKNAVGEKPVGGKD